MENDKNAMAQVMAQMNAPGADLKEFAAAYVKAWSELPVTVKTDATNPHFGNDYATLQAHLELIKPVFARNNLAVLQTPGTIEGDKLAIDTLILHTSGQRVIVKTHVPLGDKPNAQKMGGAATYGSRYVLRGIAGIAASDDDGNTASEQATASRAPRTKQAKAESDKSAEEVLALIQSFTGTEEELEKQVRPDVEALGNKDVNKAYVEKRRALKGKK